MSSPMTQLNPIIPIVAVLWVGGCGFLFYRRPHFFARHGPRDITLPTPRRIKFIQGLGVVEMTLVAVYVLSELVKFALHLLH